MVMRQSVALTSAVLLVFLSLQSSIAALVVPDGFLERLPEAPGVYISAPNLGELARFLRNISETEEEDLREAWFAPSSVLGERVEKIDADSWNEVQAFLGQFENEEIDGACFFSLIRASDGTDQLFVAIELTTPKEEFLELVSSGLNSITHSTDGREVLDKLEDVNWTVRDGVFMACSNSDMLDEYSEYLAGKAPVKAAMKDSRLYKRVAKLRENDKLPPPVCTIYVSSEITPQLVRGLSGFALRYRISDNPIIQTALALDEFLCLSITVHSLNADRTKSKNVRSVAVDTLLLTSQPGKGIASTLEKKRELEIDLPVDDRELVSLFQVNTDSSKLTDYFESVNKWHDALEKNEVPPAIRGSLPRLNEAWISLMNTTDSFAFIEMQETAFDSVLGYRRCVRLANNGNEIAQAIAVLNSTPTVGGYISVNNAWEQSRNLGELDVFSLTSNAEEAVSKAIDDEISHIRRLLERSLSNETIERSGLTREEYIELSLEKSRATIEEDGSKKRLKVREWLLLDGVTDKEIDRISEGSGQSKPDFQLQRAGELIDFVEETFDFQSSASVTYVLWPKEIFSLIQFLMPNQVWNDPAAVLASQPLKSPEYTQAANLARFRHLVLKSLYQTEVLVTAGESIPEGIHFGVVLGHKEGVGEFGFRNEGQPRIIDK